MELRIRKSRRTGFSPFELMHTWTMRSFGEQSDEDQEKELDSIVHLLENESGKLENVTDDACRTMMQRIAEVSEELQYEVELNTEKEQKRQKSSFELQHFTSGDEIKEGMLTHYYCKHLWAQVSLLKGDVVWYFEKDQKKKVKRKGIKEYKGPAKVIKVTATGAKVKYGHCTFFVGKENIREKKLKPRQEYSFDQIVATRAPKSSRLPLFSIAKMS